MEGFNSNAVTRSRICVYLGSRRRRMSWVGFEACEVERWKVKEKHQNRYLSPRRQTQATFIRFGACDFSNGLIRLRSLFSGRNTYFRPSTLLSSCSNFHVSCRYASACRIVFQSPVCDSMLYAMEASMSLVWFYGSPFPIR